MEKLITLNYTQMTQSIGMRIKELRAHYNLSMKDFAARCGISHVAIFHLESEKTIKPHLSSLQRIADAFGTTPNWLLMGNHDMLPNGTIPVSFEKIQGNSHWKDETIQELKHKNLLLEKEVERLWQVIDHFTGSLRPDSQRMRETG